VLQRCSYTSVLQRCSYTSVLQRCAYNKTPHYVQKTHSLRQGNAQALITTSVSTKAHEAHHFLNDDT
jgi:hypothetical protein